MNEDIDINDLIINKIMNSEFFYELSTKTDDYGESILKKLLNKMDCAKKIAEILKLDIIIVKAILIGIDIAYPCYGEMGEKFLKSKDELFSRTTYAVKIMKTILNEINHDKVNAIYKGIKNIVDNNLNTEEEKLVKSINVALEEIDAIQKSEIRGILMGQYISKVIESGKIVVINPLEGIEDLARREKRKLSKETIFRILEKTQNYYLTNYGEIPENFRESFEEFTKEQVVAYYIATRTQRKIEI